MEKTARTRAPARKRSAPGPAARASKQKRALTYADIRKLALSFGFPGVTEAVSWGQPCLKAHGKLWFFWSPSENAPVFKVPFEEREFLVESAPETFFFTDHYRNHPLVLARPDRIDCEWIRANLNRVWRDMAPKRVLKKWDAEHERK
jgi:hypothetical protein